MTMRESEHKEIINAISEINADLKDKFECLNNSKQKEVLENISFEVY